MSQCKVSVAMFVQSLLPFLSTCISHNDHLHERSEGIALFFSFLHCLLLFLYWSVWFRETIYIIKIIRFNVQACHLHGSYVSVPLLGALIEKGGGEIYNGQSCCYCQRIHRHILKPIVITIVLQNTLVTSDGVVNDDCYSFQNPKWTKIVNLIATRHEVNVIGHSVPPTCSMWQLSVVK